MKCPSCGKIVCPAFQLSKRVKKITRGYVWYHFMCYQVELAKYPPDFSEM